VAITDHNTIEGALQILALTPPFQIILGEEITTKQGEVIGLFLQEEIPANLSIQETIEQIHHQGGIVAVPHPCDRLRHHVLQQDCWPEILPLVDLIEGFNGRTVFKSDDQFAQKLAADYGKPVIAGSDSHTPWELGRCGMEIANFVTAQDLLKKVPESHFWGNYTSPWVHLVTKIVKYKTRYQLKKRS
jgi:predicted metal-dependent phosphoesterase TrpH